MKVLLRRTTARESDRSPPTTYSTGGRRAWAYLTRVASTPSRDRRRAARCSTRYTAGGIGVVDADAYDETLAGGCTYHVDCEHPANSEMAGLFVALPEGKGGMMTWETSD